jgi:hypothetical protein
MTSDLFQMVGGHGMIGTFFFAQALPQLLLDFSNIMKQPLNTLRSFNRDTILFCVTCRVSCLSFIGFSLRACHLSRFPSHQERERYLCVSQHPLEVPLPRYLAWDDEFAMNLDYGYSANVVVLAFSEIHPPNILRHQGTPDLGISCGSGSSWIQAPLE